MECHWIHLCQVLVLEGVSTMLTYLLFSLLNELEVLNFPVILPFLVLESIWSWNFVILYFYAFIIISCIVIIMASIFDIFTAGMSLIVLSIKHTIFFYILLFIAISKLSSSQCLLIKDMSSISSLYSSQNFNLADALANSSSTCLYFASNFACRQFSR